MAVISTKGLKVGQVMRIGSSTFEQATMKGFGSIIVDPPLRMDYPEGTTVAVAVVGNGPAVPFISMSVEDDEEADDDDSRDDCSASASTSDTSVDVKLNSTIKKTAVPAIPKHRNEVRTYHMSLVESVLQVSTMPDEKEKTYLDEVLNMKLDDPRLDVVPQRFSVLNRVLRPALERSCAKEAEFCMTTSPNRSCSFRTKAS